MKYYVLLLLKLTLWGIYYKDICNTYFLQIVYLAFAGYLYRVKDLKNALEQTVKGFVIPILIGCSIE